MDEILAKVDAAYDGCCQASLEARLIELCRETEERFGAQSREAASMASELGGYYRGQHELGKSEAQFLRAAEILESCGLTDSADYATVINNLAGTYRLLRRFDAAEEAFARSRELYRKSVGTKHILYASALNNLSLVKLDRGDRAAAKALLAEASAILAELPGHRDEYASSLINLGVLSLRCGETAAAKAALAEAIALLESELGTDTPHYHAALHALSLAESAMGDTEAARAAAEKAYLAARSLYGEAHPEVQTLRDRLSQLDGEAAP